MKYVTIIHKSVGNETVGEMWHEAKIFDEGYTLQQVVEAWGNRGNEIIIIPDTEEYVKDID